jgi:hypothetical protein
MLRLFFSDYFPSLQHGRVAGTEAVLAVAGISAGEAGDMVEECITGVVSILAVASAITGVAG